MKGKDIFQLEFAALGKQLSYADYNDGEIVIVDSVHEIPFTEAVRMGVHAALLCEKGIMQIDVNGLPNVVTEDEILYCTANGIIDNIVTSPDFKCKILFLTDNILRSFILGNAQPLHRAAYIEKVNIFPLDREAKQWLLNYYSIAQQGMKLENHPYYKEVMQSLVQSFLFFLCGHLQKYLPVAEPSSANFGEIIFQRFLDILAKEPIKRKSVDYYADKLCITPKYLSIVCHRISQRNASSWIREYTLDEIRHYLRNTDLTIKEIASMLDFPSVQSFGKYVRRYTGESPKEYRKRLLLHVLSTH
jgi:AraC-like DNA-binding protein